MGEYPRALPAVGREPHHRERPKQRVAKTIKPDKARANRAKPETPYNRLLRRARQVVHDVRYRKRYRMFRFPKEQLKSSCWDMLKVSERVHAAEQMGWEVRLVHNEVGDLVIEYVAPITVPPELQ